MRVTAIRSKKNEGGGTGLSAMLKTPTAGPWMAMVDGLARHTPDDSAITCTTRGERHLISWPRQATLRSEAGHLGNIGSRHH